MTVAFCVCKQTFHSVPCACLSDENYDLSMMWCVKRCYEQVRWVPGGECPLATHTCLNAHRNFRWKLHHIFRFFGCWFPVLFFFFGGGGGGGVGGLDILGSDRCLDFSWHVRHLDLLLKLTYYSLGPFPQPSIWMLVTENKLENDAIFLGRWFPVPFFPDKSIHILGSERTLSGLFWTSHHPHPQRKKPGCTEELSASSFEFPPRVFELDAPCAIVAFNSSLSHSITHAVRHVSHRQFYQFGCQNWSFSSAEVIPHNGYTHRPTSMPN